MTKLKTVAEHRAAIGLIGLTRMIGMGFHPDTDARDYRQGGCPGKRSYDDTRALAINQTLEDAFDLLGDQVYDLCAAEQDKMAYEQSATRFTR